MSSPGMCLPTTQNGGWTAALRPYWMLSLSLSQKNKRKTHLKINVAVKLTELRGVQIASKALFLAIAMRGFLEDTGI